MKKLVLLIVVMLFVAVKGYAQSYYKIKISSKKVKFFLKDNTKEIFEIDSSKISTTGRIFYLSYAEKKITMEFLEKEQLLRLTETFEGKPIFGSMDQINLNTVAVNRTGLW